MYICFIDLYFVLHVCSFILFVIFYSLCCNVYLPGSPNVRIFQRKDACYLGQVVKMGHYFLRSVFKLGMG